MSRLVRRKHPHSVSLLLPNLKKVSQQQQQKKQFTYKIERLFFNMFTPVWITYISQQRESTVQLKSINKQP